MARAGTNHKGGRPKGTLATHTMQAMVAKQRLIEMYGKAAEAIHLVIIKKALEGDMLAIKELHDRVWGKAYQAGEMDLTSNGKPIEISDEQYKQALAAAIKRINSNQSGT